MPDCLFSSLATWWLLFICDEMLKVKDNVIVCCSYDNLATPHEYPTAYFCAIFYSQGFNLNNFTKNKFRAKGFSFK